MTVVKIIRIEGSDGITLPDEILHAANAKPGDEVSVTVTGDGIIQIAPRGSSISEQVEKARDIASRYSNALRELAK